MAPFELALSVRVAGLPAIVIGCVWLLGGPVVVSVFESRSNESITVALSPSAVQQCDEYGNGCEGLRIRAMHERAFRQVDVSGRGV